MAKSAVATVPSEGGIAGQIKSWPLRIRTFYNDVRTEMKKVTAPNRKEVQATTVVVIITVFIFGLYFWIIDTIIGRGIDQMLRYFKTH